jgi:putative FmdB family regulatory protein
MMALYPYRCDACEVQLELQYSIGTAPSSMDCPYCGGTMRQDYQAKRVQFAGVKAAYDEDNRLTEEDRPTPEAIEALHAFAERIPPARRESGNVYSDFKFGGE